MRSLLVASFSVDSFAAFCQVNAYRSACTTPLISECVDACSLYQNENSCIVTRGCKWSETISHVCSSVDSLPCRNYSTNKPACVANNMCRWRPTECQFVPSGCSCNSLTVAIRTVADCEQAGCAIRGECRDSNRCGMKADQNSCTGSSGCFWRTGQVTFLGITTDDSRCDLCFTDPSNTENNYKTFLSHVGQTCKSKVGGNNTTTATINYHSVIAAASGCNGGSLLERLVIDGFEMDEMTCTSNETNNNNNTTKIAVGVACGVVALLCLIVCAAYALKRRRDRQREEETKLPEEKVSLHPLHGLVSEDNPEKQHD